MSTKIYNAYKWNGSLTDLPKVKSRLDKIRERAKAHFMSELGKLLPPNFNARVIIEELRRILLLRYNNSLNFNSSAVVYIHKNNIYVQFFGLDSIPNFDRWLRGFSDFHYQNQTDRPPEISDEDWAARRKVWDDIFKHNSAPSKVGFVFPIIEYETIPELVYDLVAARAVNKAVNSTTKALDVSF